MGWDETTPVSEWKPVLDNYNMSDFVRDYETPATTLDAMKDGNWSVILYQFAKSEYSTENVDFVEAAWGAGAQSGTLDMAKAKEIYDHFVKGGIVNIGGPAQTALAEAFGDDDAEHIAPPDVLDQAVKDCLTNTQDTYNRFRKWASAARNKLAEDIDWDNIQGR
jgi:hypothetical protein